MENVFKLVIDGEFHYADEIEITNKHEVLLIFNETNFDLYKKTLNAKTVTIQYASGNKEDWDTAQATTSMSYVIRIRKS